ncbi:helix-turn-helix domain-containing protein, partial [Streptomyces sp. NPDC004980]
WHVPGSSPSATATASCRPRCSWRRRNRSGTGPLAGLTPQQQRIARCVAEGATNREVALRLSVSPRTVDHHLRNVFAALGVRSRTELARLLDH